MKRDFLKEISVATGLGRHELERIVASAPARYKVYSIPKRSGGARVIAQPSSELKVIQRFLLQSFLPEMPIHEAATGYKSGFGIADNAAIHIGGSCILKLDFRDFFPSIVADDWRHFVRSSKMKLTLSEVEAFSNIFFWGKKSRVPICLSIGAPTSPALSNILCYKLDVMLADIADKNNLKYTRYADDITVSGESISDLLRFEVRARRVIEKLSHPKLTLNDEKRAMFTRGQRRMVTGVILTPDQKLSIGRDRKRLISAMLHRFVVSKLGADELGVLKGWLAYAIAVEPEFVDRMRTKYGNGHVDSVLRYQIPPRRIGK